MKKVFCIKNICLLLLCICIGGSISLILGQDIGFDIRNYHLYLPYAFLHNRLFSDIIAAGPVHTFFNPLPDIPFFLLFYYLNDWPKLTGFLLGGYYGLLLFTVYKWTSLFWQGKNRWDEFLRILTVIFSLTGMAAILQVGHSSNEELMALLAVLSAFFLFKGTQEDFSFNLKYICLATFLVSFSTGLKHTAAPAALGVGLCCLFLLIKNKSSYKKYLCILGTALGGFLLADGYFLFEKYNKLWNPFFPFFNHIFQSPLFPNEALANSPYVPNGWKEWLFLPFLRLNFPNWDYHLDFRLLLGLVSFVVLLLGIIIYIKKRPSSKTQVLLIGLFAGTYIPWTILFGNMRYSIFLEILSCILFVWLLRKFIPAKYLWVAVAGLTLFSVCRELPRWPREPYNQKNITFSQKATIKDNALVLIGGHHSFLIPFLNPKARYIGGVHLSAEDFDIPIQMARPVSPLQPLDYTHHFNPIIRKEIARHQGELYLLVPFLDWVLRKDDFWKTYGLDTSVKYCQVMRTNILKQSYIDGAMALCLVKKAGQEEPKQP